MPADPAPLSPAQRRRALAEWRTYLAAPPITGFLGDRTDGPTPGDTYVAQQADRDRRRDEMIDAELGPLTADFLAGRSDLAAFKSAVDGANKRRNLLGFSGMKGQMFFNMLYNAADRSAKTATVAEVTAELKTALPPPADDGAAAARAGRFLAFTERLAADHVAAGNSHQSKPKVSSVGFFLTSFWQIGDRDRWPAYFTNSVQAAGRPEPVGTDRRPAGGPRRLFPPAPRTGRPVRRGERPGRIAVGRGAHAVVEPGQPRRRVRESPPDGRAAGRREVGKEGGEGAAPDPDPPPVDRLPDSYIPPVIAVLPRLARNDPELEAAAANSGTSIPRALEKSVHAAFRVLGYDCTLLGQGAGRAPDGRAVDHDHGYALLWDAKAYRDSYTLGTDDRAIREYLDRGRREVPRSARNLYFVIVSGAFRDDCDDAVRSLKMDTGVSEVILCEADALVAAVDLKLRDPQAVSLGPDGVQRLFSASGKLTAADVRGLLG